MSEVLPIYNMPSVSEVWNGIAGHFDNMTQNLNEFIDNAISNFSVNDLYSRNILITVEELNNDEVAITIEDTGTGIKDLNNAFTLGCQLSRESPFNEHGFGLKHALANANPNNDSWEIITRTEEDIALHQYKIIAAPYKIKDFSATIETDSSWPGQYNSTGTIVKFKCSKELYKTIARGSGKSFRAFLTIADLLCEDLGFVYAGVIQSGLASITLEIIALDGTHFKRPVGALTPNWGSPLDQGQGVDTVDLGGGYVKIEYNFGCLNEPVERIEFNNSTSRKYYQRNMSSSGVEIRINGRVLCFNLFKEIWGIEKHNAYNYLLITINLVSDNLNALPKTRTSKNGFREGDEKLEALYDWIRARMKEPRKSTVLIEDEREFFNILKKNKLTYDSDPNKVIETEKPVFTSTGNRRDYARIDMYELTNGKINIYEGKKDMTTSKDVYQLRMYWDGLVYDKVHPNNGILVANYHPDSVKDLIQIVNTMKDANGNNYHLEAKTWAEVGLDVEALKTPH